MSHAYLFALVDGGGTVPPELGVARRLVERGHRVRVLGEDSMAADVAAAGAAFVPWRHAPNRPDRSVAHTAYRDWETTDPLALARGMADHMIAGPASGQARDVAAAIETDRPDLVLTSFTALGAMIGAEANGVPFDVLLPNIYTMPAPGMPPMGLGLRPATGRQGVLRDRAMNAMSTRLLGRYGLDRVNAARAAHGLAPVPTIWDQVHRARRELVMTSPAFDFPATLPANARYVGPVLDDPPWAGGDWTPPPGDQPLVLVAMSSTFQDQTGCLQRIADALGALPVRGLVTTGPALDPSTIHASPNVRVVAAAPHAQVLPVAAAVVTHGGHGTVIKALAAGLPTVVLPHGRDQADNAVRIADRGAGITISRESSTPAIARAINRVLSDPAFARAARTMGAAVAQDAAGDALLRELENLEGASPAEG
ncbi:nucleotide disphospho-sugar-binding domain-containing protein [Occultella gossypii]|uniref:Glycosyltransferase family 1 protein n=1 Tax=Occultella gossypii TaxID=2800820 RepID=A0ABS7S7V3_9MICO|nr:glycosyltransferase [Occultella gossypii]MBZ2196167.1 glycosyltransferase family 1 protein [Occultella gossypii]